METVKKLIDNLKNRAGLTNEKLASMLGIKQPNFQRLSKNNYPKDRAHLQLITFIQDITGLKGKPFESFIKSIHENPYFDFDQELQLPKTNHDRSIKLYINEMELLIEKLKKRL